MNVLKLVKGIEFPTTNNYYEKCSADGYAFLGHAQGILNLDYTRCFNEMIKSNLTLNADRQIHRTKAKVYKKTLYVYTFWSCVEFLQVINEEKRIAEIMQHIEEIGQYKINGMMRYCTTEINYVVPNVTALGALLHAYAGNFDECRKLVELLDKRQINGNWKYGIIKGQKEIILHKRTEDTHHLAMMIYALRMIHLISDIDTSHIIHQSLGALHQDNKKRLQGGSIGWGIPMLYLATKNLDNSLAKRSLNTLLKKSINNSNFRVRGISAFCLTKNYD